MFEAFCLTISYDKLARRIEISATITEAIAEAFENAKDLPEEVSSVAQGHSGGGIRTRDLRVMRTPSGGVLDRMWLYEVGGHVSGSPAFARFGTTAGTTLDALSFEVLGTRPRSSVLGPRCGASGAGVRSAARFVPGSDARIVQEYQPAA